MLSLVIFQSSRPNPAQAVTSGAKQSPQAAGVGTTTSPPAVPTMKISFNEEIRLALRENRRHSETQVALDADNVERGGLAA